MKRRFCIEKLSLVLLFLMGSHLMVSAQNQLLPGDVTGRWFQPDENPDLEEWQASWIWVDEALGADRVLARRTFDLTSIPQEALLRITASSQYQLFINGKYICRGPARSAPHHQSFDLLDLKKVLEIGKNCIAVRVHHQQNKRSYHFKGRAGLLAQLEMTFGEEQTIIATDQNWKVIADPSWQSDVPVISRFQMVVSDWVDLEKHLHHWNAILYDDSSWPFATALMRHVGWPFPAKNAKPQPLTPPWTTLVPRDVPYLQEQEELALRLMEARKLGDQIAFPLVLTNEVEASLIDGLEEDQKATRPLLIKGEEQADNYFLLFDFGQIRNGFPQLEVKGSSGTQIQILCAPFLIDNQFTPKILDSDFTDRITLSGKIDQWEATYFKPARYLGLLIKNAKEVVQLHKVGIRYMEYPFQQNGYIQSTDAEWVGRYMDATAKTIKVCTTDGYTDNYRERRQYAQTGYYAALGNNWLFGDANLQRRYLIQVAQEQEANGIMPAYAPLGKDDYMVILDSNCLWLRSLRDYLLYTGDEKTVRELLPAAYKLLDLLYSFTNSLGMLYNPPYPYWLDHSRIDRRGGNLCLNGHYLGALEDFAELLDWLEEEGSEKFKMRASSLRQSLRKNLWEEQTGLFADAWIDGERSTQFSEHANAMALAMKVATSEQADRIIPQILINDDLNYTTRVSGMTMVTPAMSYFLHKGLCMYGQIDASFELFRRRFDKMLSASHHGTLWEEWWLDGTGRSGQFVKGKTRSDAQTESAFPPALFGAYLLGVQPIKPGWKEVVVSRQNHNLEHIEGQVPTPLGLLKVVWSLKAGQRKTLLLEVPPQMQIKLDVGSLNGEKPSIMINESLLKASDYKNNFFILAEGKHQITF